MPGPQLPELVNPVPVDEVSAWVRSMATTFLIDLGKERIDSWVGQLTDRWEPDRAWGVRDRGQWVGTLRTEPRRLTVPAPLGQRSELAVDALTNVTVAPTHRRQGLMSRMLNGSLQDARERGEALSILIAAEWPIYGRFGYAPATTSCDYVLRRSRPGAHVQGDMTAIRRVELDAVVPLAVEVFDRARWRWAGQLDRDEQWWKRNLASDGGSARRSPPPNWLIHEGEDGLDGILGWTPEGEPSLAAPDHRVIVSSLFAATDAAYRNLWSYLTAIDGIEQVSLSERPVHEPVRWLLDDARTLTATRQIDFLWIRLLDVPAALSARRYATAGELVVEVSDPDGAGFAAGRYGLLAGPDGAECERTDREPDVVISQRALASIYLGGYRLAELRVAGAAREHTPGALERLDVMFSWPVPPWNATWF